GERSPVSLAEGVPSWFPTVLVPHRYTDAARKRVTVDASDRLEQMLEDLVQIVETAKAVPMSASCVINRSEALEILHQLRAGLAEELEESRRLTAERDDVIAQARRDAQRHIEDARRERGSMLSGTEMGREAERIRNEALREAQRIRDDADAYVDDRLANFEVV